MKKDHTTFKLITPFIWCLDKSCARTGEGRRAMLKILQDFKAEMLENEYAKEALYMEVIQFAKEPEIVFPFGSIGDFEPEKMEINGENFSSLNQLLPFLSKELRGVRESLAEKGFAQCQPRIFLITDGGFSRRCKKALKKFRCFKNGALGKEFIVLEPEKADHANIKEAVSQINGYIVPANLPGLSYRDLFWTPHLDFPEYFYGDKKVFMDNFF